MRGNETRGCFVKPLPSLPPGTNSASDTRAHINRFLFCRRLASPVFTSDLSAKHSNSESARRDFRGAHPSFISRDPAILVSPFKRPDNAQPLPISQIPDLSSNGLARRDASLARLAPA